MQSGRQAVTLVLILGLLWLALGSVRNDTWWP